MNGLDRLVLPEEVLAALEEAVSSWRLCVCASRNSFINSQRWIDCWVSRSVTALIWRSTSSEVTASLDDVSISGSDILLGVCSNKLSVSVLLSVSSISIATDLFKYQRKGLWLDYIAEFSRFIVNVSDEI